MQFRQNELVDFALIQVVEAEAGEVGNQDIAGQVAFLESREIPLGGAGIYRPVAA